MLYGEGKNAFRRLQLEIIRMSNDHSVFAWDADGRIGLSGSVLAEDPSFFCHCHDIVKMELRDEFINCLEQGEDKDHLDPIEKLNTFAVTNGGIQIQLSIILMSGDVTPANNRTKVVFPVRFSLNITTSSKSVKLSPSTVRLKFPKVFVMAGYW